MKTNKELFIFTIVFLCGLAGFCVWKYLGANRDLAVQKAFSVQLKDKNMQIVKKLESQIAKTEQLAKEKKHLQQDLKLNNEKLDKLNKRLGDSKQELAKMKSISRELARANELLRKKRDILQSIIDKLATEKKELLTKLSSIDELNALIKDLRKAGRIKADRGIPAGKKIKKDRDEIAGNRGYIIYRGMPTYKSRVSIQVVPGD